MKRPAPLERLAARITDCPFFCARRLRQYGRKHKLDLHGLAERLGCSLSTLQLVRLCRAPQREADVQQIADRFELDPDRLREMLAEG